MLNPIAFPIVHYDNVMHKTVYKKNLSLREMYLSLVNPFTVLRATCDGQYFLWHVWGSYVALKLHLK